MIEALVDSSAGMGILAIIAIVIVTQFLRHSLQSSSAKIPIIGDAKANDFRSALKEGWTKFRDSIYEVPMHHHNTTILPIKYVDEIKSLSEDKLSFQQDVHIRFQGRYTEFTLHDKEVLIDVVKQDLTRSLVPVLADLQDEAVYISKTEIGDFKGWKAITMYPAMLRMVGLISGRVFVGLPLSRNEEWINTTINYTVDTVAGSAQLIMYPWWTRPIVARFNPLIRSCHRRIAKALQLMSPIVTSRLSQGNDSDHQKPNDIIQWHLDKSAPDMRRDLLFQAKGQLKLSFAALHTTSQAATHVLFDLAYRPEYITDLRQELEAVLAQTNDGILTKQSITKLYKLDSFMKESQRLNPPNMIGLRRKIISDIKLKDGTVLPAGSFTGTDIWGSMTDRDTWGDNAEEFDGYRFEKLRSEPGNENKYHFVTASLDSLNFGIGSHACPGRFFASNEMKVLICRIISDYDIKLEDGAPRPENRYINSQVHPSATAKVLFHKRVIS